jgi:hypothetical protein
MERIRLAIGGGLVVLVAVVVWTFARANTQVLQFTMPPERIGDPHQAALAHDRDAQAALREALVAAQPRGDLVSYKDATPIELATVEPSLSFVGARTASVGPSKVSVRASLHTWAAAALSRSGTCFFIKETTRNGTSYGSGNGTCTGDQATVSATERWFSSSP